jgi:hypothetical protein
LELQVAGTFTRRRYVQVAKQYRRSLKPRRRSPKIETVSFLVLFNIRELLANALVHRPYTTRGDIFINLYPDRLEVHNPGLLPLGVTPANILHTSIKRNELLAKVFFDLKLMEREGSGYDRMYEALLSTGRPGPVVKEGDDRVVVTVQRRIVNPEIVDFMIKADQTFALTQKERITLGLIAQEVIERVDRWTEKEQTQAEVKSLILDHVFATLPDPPFTDLDKEAAADRLFQHVWHLSASGGFAAASAV